jgi:ABC-type Co2+ transport system permease subunit
MDRRSRTILRSILIGYIALIAASILTDSPILATAADLGFAGVAGFFAYAVYANCSPSDDRRIVLGSVVALAAAAVAQVLALLSGLAAVETASTILFVIGFLGYFVLRRQ